MIMRRSTSLVRIARRGVKPQLFVALLLPVVLFIGAGSLFLACNATPDGDDWPKVSKSFQQAVASGHVEAIEKAALVVIADNSKRAVELVLKALKTTTGAQYWTLIVSLGGLTSEDSLNALASEILSGAVPEIRRDLVAPLRLSTGDAVDQVLQKLLKEGAPEIQVSAMDEIVDRCAFSAAPLLFDLAEKDPQIERELTRRVFKALKALSKETPVGGPTEWRQWWKTVKDGLTADQRQLKAGSVGQTVADTIRRARATDFEDLKRGSKEEILVISGASDSVQDVLVSLGVPHTVVAGDRVERNEDLGLEKYAAVIVNCGPQGWPSTQIARVRKFVVDGGYLCVTDLIIQHLVKDAFPGYYVNKGGLPDAVVSILPWRGSTGNPLLRGVELPIASSKGAKPRMEWMIAPGGPALTFDPKKVVWLVDAPELALKKKFTSVAVTFLYGCDQQLLQQGVDTGGVYEELGQVRCGRVLCVLSHFGKQRQGEDSFALQNMLLNFLIEARDRQLMREDARGKKK